MQRYLVTILLATTLHAGEAPSWTGFLGPNGTGVWPDAKPPTVWDGKTGKNILWKVPVANWGFGQPVVLKGRVFVVSEPGWKHDWPLLQCFDEATGKKVWEKELNTLDLLKSLSAAERAELAKLMAEEWAYQRNWYTARQEFASETPEGREKGAKLLRAMGLLRSDAPIPEKFDKNKLDPAPQESNKVRRKHLEKIGWLPEIWHTPDYASGTMVVGYAFPTPATDGKRLYVATGLDTFWCFDPDGKQIWGMHARSQKYTGDFCNRARSPLLYKNLFISDLGNFLRFIDVATGALIFSCELSERGGCTIASPVVIRIGTQDFLLCCKTDSSGLRAFRLPDGKEYPIAGWGNPGASMQVNVDQPDTVFFTGGDQHGGWGKGQPPPAAVRFSLTGETLSATVLWSGIDGKVQNSHAGILYFNGKVYQKSIIDAKTGKSLGELKVSSIPLSRGADGNMSRQIANGQIFGMNTDGVMQINTLDGNLVSGNFLPPATVEGEKRDQIKAQEMATRNADKSKVEWWYPYSYSAPFIITGKRIYARSNDDLWCIGEP